MKVAYLGRSPTSLKALSGLKQYFNEADYYLLSEDSSLNSPKAFNQLSMMTDLNYISIREDELTPAQLMSYENLEVQYGNFKKLFFGSVLNEEENQQQTSDESAEVQIKNLKSPFTMTYLSDEKKYLISCENQSNLYDFILSENTGFKGYCPLKKDPFTFFNEKYCFYNIEYSYEKKSAVTECFNVLWVDSEFVSDINDNWNVVHLMKNCVRIVIPILKSQIDNQDYVEFVKKRTYEKFSSQFPVIGLTDILREFIIPTNENFEQFRNSFSEQQIILMPDLTYWTQAQVERFIQDSFSAGKYRSFFKSKETTL